MHNLSLTYVLQDSTHDSFTILVKDCPSGQLLRSSSVINGVPFSSCVCNEESIQILECGVKNVSIHVRIETICFYT